MEQMIANPLTPTPAGTCRYCGCTDDRACTIRLSTTLFRGCAWADVQHTVCDTSACLQTWCKEMATELVSGGIPA